MSSRSALWVVKIGGSVAGSPALTAWLRVLSPCRKPRVVIVPGGGPFADAVRKAQRASGFDDGPAHRMAMLAMEQFGLMLSGLSPDLHPADSKTAIRTIHRRGGVPVWLPTRMAAASRDIRASWEVTSDSLAAWLAGVLGANRLVLVKAAEPPPHRGSAAELRDLGLIAKAFPSFIDGRGFETWCVSSAHHRDMARALESGTGPGTRIVTGAYTKGR